jgi:hypothetical protein
MEKGTYETDFAHLESNTKSVNLTVLEMKPPSATTRLIPHQSKSLGSEGLEPTTPAVFLTQSRAKESNQSERCPNQARRRARLLQVDDSVLKVRLNAFAKGRFRQHWFASMA